MTTSHVQHMTLACPFCGAQPVVEKWHGGGPEKRIVACENEECPVMPAVTRETKARAIHAWNHRAPEGS